MDRKKLINRLVDRCLASKGKGKTGCVPCFARNVCFARVERNGQVVAKK